MGGKTVRKIGIFLIVVGIFKALLDFYSIMQNLDYYHFGEELLYILSYFLAPLLISVSVALIGYFIYKVGDSRPDLIAQRPYTEVGQPQPGRGKGLRGSNICPSCGERVDPTEKFCKFCGAELR